MQVSGSISTQISHYLLFHSSSSFWLVSISSALSLSLCCMFLSFSISRLQILCVSVYNSDSLLASLIQSPSLSAALFHPPSSSPSVTLIPCLIHWRFIGIQAELFCQAITVQNSMKTQYSKCVSLTPPPFQELPFSFCSFDYPLSFFFTLSFFMHFLNFKCCHSVFRFYVICQHLSCLSAQLSSALSSSCQSLPSLSIQPLTP